MRTGASQYEEDPTVQTEQVDPPSRDAERGSPSDLLHETATLMRQRAEAATESIDAVLDDILGDDATGLDGTWDEMVTSLRTLEGSPGDHVASWHPAVALAVADLLDTAQAHYANEYGDGCVLCSPGESGWPCSTNEEAVAVARAYLGRPS